MNKIKGRATQRYLCAMQKYLKARGEIRYVNLTQVESSGKRECHLTLPSLDWLVGKPVEHFFFDY